MSISSLTEIPGISCWVHAGAEVYSDAGVTPAVNNDPIQQLNDVSGIGLIASQPTAGQRPKLKAATLAVPSIEFSETLDTALLFAVNNLDLRANDATFLIAFQSPLPIIGNSQRMAGNWAGGVGPKGISIGISLGTMKQTFVQDGTNYAGINQAHIEVTWGDPVIVVMRWDNSAGKFEILTQRSDKTTFITDGVQTVAAMSGADIDSTVQFAIGRCNGGTTVDWTGRITHFAAWIGKYFTDLESQDALDYIRSQVDRVPSLWTSTRNASNPVNTLPPTEVREQYVPAPIVLPDNSRWLYCKGTTDIYVHRAPDFTTNTFTLMNSGAAVLTDGGSGADDELAAIDPYAQFEPGTNTIHIYYKGINGSVVPSSMYATASGATPVGVTKQSTVLTAADFATAFGGETVTDFHVACRILKAGTWHVFGDRKATTGTKSGWRLWRGTDSGFGTAITPLAILDWPRGAGDYLVQRPSIFKNPNGAGYFLIYTVGKEAGGDGERNLYCCFADDIDTDDWQHSGTILIHQSTGWEQSRVYAAQMLMQPGGDYDMPILINGSYQLFYSGSDRVVNDDDLVGILNMTPTGGGGGGGGGGGAAGGYADLFSSNLIR